MTSVLHRRLAKIEAELNPPSETVICLDEPGVSADDAAWLAFRKRLEEAKATSARVIVVRDTCSTRDKEFSEDYGVMVMGPIEAAYASLASQKSQQGRANRLADVLASLNGSTLAIIADPVDSNEEA